MIFSDNVKEFLKSTSGFVTIAFLLVIVAVFLNWPLAPVYSSDVNYYLAIANGHISGIVKPFTSRFLEPFLAGWFSGVSSLNLNQIFLLFNVLALVVFFLAAALILRKTVRSAPLLLFVLPLPWLFARFGDYFSPDIFYAALTALFFLFLFYKKEGLALLVLFLLFLTRESTVLLGFIFLAVTIWRSKKMMALTALIVVGLSFFTANQIGNLGLPNAHNLSDIAYLVLRLPFLTFRNLGIIPWVNTLPGTCEPIFKLGLPHLSVLGRIQSIGFCNFDFSMLFTNLASFISVLGIMPLTLFYLLSKKYKEILKGMPRWMLVALLCGLGYFVLTIGSTTGVPRFVGYSWPAFLFVVPFLFIAYFEIRKDFLIKILLINIFVMWLPVLLGLLGSNVLLQFVIFILVLAANIYAWHLLGRQELKKIEALPQ